MKDNTVCVQELPFVAGGETSTGNGGKSVRASGWPCSAVRLLCLGQCDALCGGTANGGTTSSLGAQDVHDEAGRDIAEGRDRHARARLFLPHL